jgi:hypothetical protein
MELTSPRLSQEEWDRKYPILFKERLNDISLEVRAGEPDKMLEICAHFKAEDKDSIDEFMGLSLGLTEKDGLDLLALLLEFFQRT